MKFLGVNVNKGDYIKLHLNNNQVKEGIVYGFSYKPKKGLIVGRGGISYSEDSCACVEIHERWDKEMHVRIHLLFPTVSRGLSRSELHRLIYSSSPVFIPAMVELKGNFDSDSCIEHENMYLGLIKECVPEAYILYKKPFGFLARCVDGDLKVLLLGNKDEGFHLAFYSKQDK